MGSCRTHNYWKSPRETSTLCGVGGGEADSLRHTLEGDVGEGGALQIHLKQSRPAET